MAGGNFTIAGGASANNIACWNGASWSPLSSGMNGRVLALVVMPNGDLVAGGSFTTAGGVGVWRIARWNGASWFALSPSGVNAEVHALAASALPLPIGRWCQRSAA